VDAIESQNLGEVMKGGHGGLGHRLPAASNPEAGLSAVGAVLWQPRRDRARAKPLRRSYAIILAPSLMKLKPIDLGGLGPMDFFPTNGFLCHYGFAAWSERLREKSKS
jgi:hypothetical protein